MKRLLLILLSTSLAVSAAAVLVRGRQSAAAPFPPVPTDPRALPVALVHAQPFTLEQPFTHWWRSEMPEFRAGYLLVLATHRDLLVRRQLEEPVLYVGSETAERINNGDGEGRLVALVPSEVDAAGRPVLDLSLTPMWFGDPALPERVDRAEAERQLELYVARGGTPRPAQEVAEALARGGPVLELDTRVDLQLFAADLVELYAPSETELAENLRVGR
jgi:hypothetical protein